MSRTAWLRVTVTSICVITILVAVWLAHLAMLRAAGPHPAAHGGGAPRPQQSAGSRRSVTMVRSRTEEAHR